MRDEENGRAVFLHLPDATHAAMLKDRVADREGFVDDQDLRMRADGNGEGEADVHAARIGLDVLVN